MQCRSIEEDRATDTNYEISCSIVEIYNEVRSTADSSHLQPAACASMAD